MDWSVVLMRFVVNNTLWLTPHAQAWPRYWTSRHIHVHWKGRRRYSGHSERGGAVPRGQACGFRASLTFCVHRPWSQCWLRGSVPFPMRWLVGRARPAQLLRSSRCTCVSFSSPLGVLTLAGTCRYCSDQSHSSVQKAANIAGIRGDRVRVLATEANTGSVSLWSCVSEPTYPQLLVEQVRAPVNCTGRCYQAGQSSRPCPHGVHRHVRNHNKLCVR